MPCLTSLNVAVPVMPSPLISARGSGDAASRRGDRHRGVSDDGGAAARPTTHETASRGTEAPPPRWGASRIVTAETRRGASERPIAAVRHRRHARGDRRRRQRGDDARVPRLFGVPDAFEGIELAGRTDASIVGDAFARHGMPPTPATTRAFRDATSSLPAGRDAAARRRQARASGRRAAARGARADDRDFLGLLTGNYAEAARVKLEHFDLWRLFPVRRIRGRRTRSEASGADGDRRARGLRASPSRPPTSSSSAIRRATSRARARTARSASPSRPASIRVEAACAAGADVVFEDLWDTGACCSAGAALEIGGRRTRLRRANRCRHTVELRWRKRLGVEPSLPASAGSDRF